MIIKFDPEVSLKDTYNKLAEFPRFSLIQKIQPKFTNTSLEGSLAVAKLIKQTIIAKNLEGRNCVLGLATGSTPLAVYRQLIRMHEKGEVSFKKVVTFNLDEYYPIKKDNNQSYNHYMHFNLFNYIDIPKENIHIPDGQIEQKDIKHYCSQYQKSIKQAGGIDLQILGIGRTGHIGFNEPPSPVNSITRLVYLHRLTRKDAASSFGGVDKVPKCAITMGISTIRQASKIVIMAWSESKSFIVKRSIEGEASTDIPSTFLHSHEDATFYLDKAAGEKLSRFHVPWTIKGDSQDPFVPNSCYWMMEKVIWLSERVCKPILRLSFNDYEDNHLSKLVFDCANGQAEQLNLFVYKQIIKKITGWPLGRPLHSSIDSSMESSSNFSKKAPIKERVLIFSPHPDDDVISMGGTIKKLQEQGHQIHIVYMTSGANAVYNHDVKKYLSFFKDFSNSLLLDQMGDLSKETVNLFEKQKIKLEEIISSIDRNEESLKSNEIMAQAKRSIRMSEAKISVNQLGVPSNQTYCLNLPFYGSHLKKKLIGQVDYNIVQGIIKFINPTFMFAAGDLTDPHGTHRKCLNIIMRLYEQDILKELPERLFPPAERIFLYRGAWEEWSIAVADIITPLSPLEVNEKLLAILKHQSQKDSPMFPGEDKREFWERVQQRNRNTAETLKRLGLSEYEAAECFVNVKTFLTYEELQ